MAICVQQDVIEVLLRRMQGMLQEVYAEGFVEIALYGSEYELGKTTGYIRIVI
jgi:hypothetical protein